MTRVDPVAIKGCARVDERSVLYTTMYDVRFPEVYLIFRLISIKAAGGAGWRSWLADRRYRGTRCLFANAHRALMNLWTRQEARRIEIRPDTSYFFLSPLSFFLPPLPPPFHSPSITFAGIAKRRFNRHFHERGNWWPDFLRTTRNFSSLRFFRSSIFSISFSRIDFYRAIGKFISN